MIVRSRFDGQSQVSSALAYSFGDDVLAKSFKRQPQTVFRLSSMIPCTPESILPFLFLSRLPVFAA